MTSFVEDLWNSIFTPGPTPTLLLATNASFAALQLLLLVLLITTYNIHFFVLSALTGGLWYSINWFAREVQLERAREEEEKKRLAKDKSPEPGSDTETETAPSPPAAKSSPPLVQTSPTFLQPKVSPSEDQVRRRRSLGDSSGYVSTDSEWEKVSEGEEKNR